MHRAIACKVGVDTGDNCVEGCAITARQLVGAPPRPRLRPALDESEGKTEILDRLVTVEGEIISLRKQVLSVQEDSLRRDQSMAALSLNVDRINSRLELTNS